MEHGLKGLALTLLFAAAAVSCGEDPVELGQIDEAIGPDGGTFATEDGRVILDVPPGALNQAVTITATPVSASTTLPVVGGTAWELGPDGTEFAEPVGLTIRYDPADVSGNQADLRIVEVIEASGELELAVHVGHDEAASTVTAAIRHFSTRGVATCTGGCLPAPALTAEYEGSTEGVTLSWPTPTWSWVRIYRAAFRQCEAGEASGQYGPYTCVSSSAEAQTPPPECIAPGTAPDGRDCVYTLHTQAPGSSGGIPDRWLGSRGAVFWYQARGGRDDDPFRAWSFPPQQITHFGTPDPPEVPADFAATAVSDSAIRLTWQPTPTASGYELERSVDGGWSGPTLPYSDFEYTDEGLEPDRQYQYRIRSVNENGASAYAFASATTGDAAGSGCQDFDLRLDFNPIDVAGGASDVVPVFIDRVAGFTGQVELALGSVPGGPLPADVIDGWAFTPNPADGAATSSTLSFTMRADVAAGASYDLQIVAGSPLLETAPELCSILVTFDVIQ